MRTIIFALALALPYAGHTDTYTGAQMLSSCNVYLSQLASDADQPVRVDRIAEGVQCREYLFGVVNGIDITADLYQYAKDKPLHSFCVPDTLSRDQAVQLFVKYAEAHPDQLHVAASELVWFALHEAFPCSQEKDK